MLNVHDGDTFRVYITALFSGAKCVCLHVNRLNCTEDTLFCFLCLPRARSLARSPPFDAGGRRRVHLPLRNAGREKE